MTNVNLKTLRILNLCQGKIKGDKSPSFVKGLKFCSININGIRGKILELLAFLDTYQAQVVASQETKTDNTVTTSELLPETCVYSVYRKYRNTHGGER